MPNPSFEICSNCDDSYTIFIPNGPIIPGWSNPNILTPDFISIPSQNFLPFDTISGNNFLGIVSYQSIFNDPSPESYNQREYLQCELNDTLIYKKFYKIDFYTLSFIYDTWGNFLTNNLGIYFSTAQFYSNNGNYIDSAAQVKYFQNEIIKNPLTWEKFSGIYQAEGGEKFMTVGNFNSDVETSFICQSPFWPAQGKGYVYLDKFALTPLDSIPGGLQVNAGIDQTICPGDTVFIGEKISNLPANWYLLDGTEVAINTAGVYVAPTVTTTYIVTLAINGVYSTDTVTVTVGCANLEEFEKPLFTIYPNPSNGEFFVRGLLEQQQILILSTIDNKQVCSLPVEGKIEQIVKINDFDSGVYFLSIWDVNQKLLFRKKIINSN
ncbi:T9SS type A sorting domain-containing protein [Flavobacterium sp.]|uniref:T9SS type A sorting domain-containing protein n=1 Tax=Flavobacterium sp. TaxID=239 RepID=UPI0025F35D65|nr:T9SS type A sorting domain-containing protein [Flavobacterium sp.]